MIRVSEEDRERLLANISPDSREFVWRMFEESVVTAEAMKMDSTVRNPMMGAVLGLAQFDKVFDAGVVIGIAAATKVIAEEANRRSS